MKNKLYVSLFAIAVSGSITVSATGANGEGINPMFAEKSAPKSMWSAKRASSKSVIVGGNPGTWAPSEQENNLRHLAGSLEMLNPKVADELREIANSIGQLRMHDLAIFNKYFGKSMHSESETTEPKMEEAQSMDNESETTESEDDFDDIKSIAEPKDMDID